MPIWRGITSTDWNTASNWVIDGLGNSGVPAPGTDAIFDVLSSAALFQCTTGTAVRDCRDLITTGFTGTLQIGSTIAGLLRVHRNVTLGSQPGHITGIANLTVYAASGSITLDVQTGVIIPSLSIAPNANFTLNVILTRTTVVTDFKKEGVAGSNANFVSGGGSVELQVSNMRYTFGAGDFRFAANTALRFVGSATYDSFTFGGGSLVLDTGATLTPIPTANPARINLGVIINLRGTLNINFTAGTLIYPALSNTNRLGTYLSLGDGAMTFNFGSNTIENITAGASINGLSIALQSNLVVNRTLTLGFGVLFTGGFNVIVKETLSRNSGLIRNNVSGKIIYQGTSTGFIGMGYISGTTFNITSVIQGSISNNSVIHAPSVSTATNYITGVTAFETTYSVTTSQTIGSIGSPVMFYGYGIGNLSIGEAVGSNVVLEIDAGSNSVYLLGALSIVGTSSEFRYLSTNTGIFDGSKGNITVTPSGGIIDFQGQSSPTKFIGTLVNAGFYAGATLKSDIYVTTFSLLNGAGLLQTGSRTVYVSGNISAQNGVGAVIGSNNGVVTQPTIELIGTVNCNFSCSVLNANIKINKDPLAIVTVTQSFTYGTGVGSPYTFEYQNGIMNFGATTMSILSNCSIINPASVGNFSFANITVGSFTLTITNLLTVTGSLSSTGNSTFIGTHGWTTNNFTHAGAGFTCTLKAGNTYTVNGIFTMIGTPSSRAVIQSNDAVAVTANIGSFSDQLNVTVGSVPNPAAGYVLGSTSTALPPALNNLLPNRPTILSGTSSPYTLVSAIGATALASGSYTLGKKAFLRVTNGSGSTNVSYVTTRDIDSDGGITILAFGSYSDAIGQPSANIFRTLNWGPLIAPSGSVYYTFVS